MGRSVLAGGQPSSAVTSPRGPGVVCRLLRAFRRSWRRARRRMSRHGVHFVYHDVYERSVGGVPLDAKRGERILAFLSEEGLLEREDISIPRPPSLRNLLRVHTADYLESLQEREVVERIFGVAVGDEKLEQVVELQRLTVGGTIQASRLALQSGGVAVNLGGGFHHAERSSGMAFCIFNDIAIAISRLRAKGFKGPILVIDLDLHDGNGTRTIFANDPTVYTYSVHNQDWGETEAEASTAIALGAEVTDEIYLGTLLKTLPDVAESVRPGFVVYVAGTDVAADDALGNWKISAQGMLRRDRFVMSLFRSSRRPVPMLVVLGGGYGDRSWRYSARFLSTLLAGRVIEPPASEELTVMRFRRIWRTLDPAALTSEPNDFSWSLTAEDLVGIMPGPRGPTRFLGYFSRHGVELMLERFGILDQLRVRGYSHPAVEIDLSHPMGQTVRVWGDGDRAELLMELRVDRSQRAVSEREVLVVEWLLLQNPRAEFGPFRRPLPGQQHPGLRMLREVFGWLVVVSETLSLDGIYFSASHYHVAAVSRRVVRFLDPADEAFFQALREALGELPLSRASRLIAEGRVVDAASGEPVSWHGCPMVLPVSDALRDAICGPAYEAAAARHAEGLRYRVVAAEPGHGPASVAD